MASAPLDYLVIGSTPLAGLLAGLLASVHGKSVILIADTSSAFRLTRGFDLSVGAITRPETWALLGRTLPETTRLVAKIGARQALPRLDPLFVADGQDSADGLAHCRQVAAGNGQAVDRLTPRAASEGHAAIVIRDAVMLARRPFEAALMPWLAASGVLVLPSEGTKVVTRRDGSARIERDGVQHNVMDVVLADGAAILKYLGRGLIAPVLDTIAATSVATERVKALPARFVTYVDRGVQLHQAAGGQVSALALGASEPAIGRLRTCLADLAPVRRAGQVTFHRLSSRDGAPVVGAPKGSRLRMVAGLGPVGFFLAPALARVLAGAPAEGEDRYFADRSANADQRSVAVAEFDGTRPASEAA